MRNLFRALRLFKSDRLQIAFALGLMLAGALANLLKPWPLAILVDAVVLDKALPSWMSWAGGLGKGALLSLLTAAVLFLYLAAGGFSAWQNYLSIQIGLRGLARVRKELFERLQRLSLRFHQGNRAGDLLYRASWDTYAFQTLFQQGIFTWAQASLSLGLMLAIMWQVNLPLTFLSIGTLPVLLLAMRVFGREMNRRSLGAHQADSEVTSSFQQNIAALPLIQSYTREEEERRRFSAKADAAFAKRLSQHGWEVLYSLSVAFGFGVAIAAITWVGIRQVLAGGLTVGELLIFLAYLGQLYEPLNQLSHVGATVSDARAGTQRVFEILDAPEEVRDAVRARPIARSSPTVEGAEAVKAGATNWMKGKWTRKPAAPEPLILKGHIAFDRVGFWYREGAPVLNSISVCIHPGEAVGIIGPSGAGKTTLLQLLPRFFDPSQGAIRLDGVDLRELRLRDLRSAMALVLQEPFLLPATLAENIAYGKPEAGADEVEAAARAAFAHEFIEKLPQGYETVVGEGSARLSVGEKQRINLARAFLKDAPILLLDEPTSALDAESERLVVEGLSRLMKGRTTLLVAHRLSTIRQVDRVIALRGGGIHQIGSPAEVLPRGPEF